MSPAYRELFHKIINADRDPAARSQAAAFLESRLGAARDLALQDLADGKKSLGSFYNSYDQEAAMQLLNDEYRQTLDQYDAYLARRQSSGPEMLPNLEFAKLWLVNIAPTKLVDGSWLQHVGKVNVPQDLQRFHALLFKVFVDELGEGQLRMNHTTAYLETLESVGIFMPAVQSHAFVDQECLLDSSFECGLVQLCLSQFPESMLPEIIGYNAGYEQLPLHLLISSKELEELDIDPNYFLLHISIDNHSNGHAQVAIKTAFEYLDYIRSSQSEEEMLRHWQRILNGYFLNYLEPAKKDLARIRHLAHSIPPSQLLASPPDLLVQATGPHDLTRRRMLRILRSKSLHGAEIHPPSAKIFGKSIRELLGPKNADLDASFAPLLDTLASSSRWIVKGKPEESPFLTDLCAFGGKMFGIFTKDELVVLTDWIRDLGAEDISVEVGDGEPPVQLELPPVLRDPPHNLDLHLGHSDAPRRRISAILAHVAGGRLAQPEGLVAALQSWEVEPEVEIAAKAYVEKTLRDIASSNFENLLGSEVLRVVPSASDEAALESNSSNSKFYLLELDGVLLQDFFVPHLHATPVGELLLRMWMKVQDYEGEAGHEPTFAMFKRILDRQSLESQQSASFVKYRAFLLCLSRFPTQFTPELLGAIGFWINLAYGPNGLTARFPCQLSGFEKRRILHLQQNMQSFWAGLAARAPSDWTARMSRGYQAGKRLYEMESKSIE